MTALTVQFLGSGDAFGSGGRFQACIAIGDTKQPGRYLLDCGATSLVAMKRVGFDPGSVEAVLVSHLHGDHFGGIPFLVLDGQFSRRERPLLVAGPPGVQARVLQAMEVLYPGSTAVQRRFDLRFLELEAGRPAAIGSATVTGYEVLHASGAPAYALRLELGGKVIAYSGDTEWSEALVTAARGTDLFICEAYFFDKDVKNHLSYRALLGQLDRLECRRLILTHLSADMLARRAEASHEAAEDGLVLTI